MRTFAKMALGFTLFSSLALASCGGNSNPASSNDSEDTHPWIDEIQISKHDQSGNREDMGCPSFLTINSINNLILTAHDRGYITSRSWREETTAPDYGRFQGPSGKNRINWSPPWYPEYETRSPRGHEIIYRAEGPEGHIEKRITVRVLYPRYAKESATHDSINVTHPDNTRVEIPSL
jgi:hypothetical protein